MMQDGQTATERRQGGARKRLLVLGAYGNGNLGDQYQANAVARHLRRHLDCEVDAISGSPTKLPFEFEDGAVLRRGLLDDHDLINGYDGLVIGGGGLFAAPHHPLAEDGWADAITCPVVLFGIGAAPKVVAECRPIIERARVVTARDAFSLDAVRAVRPDASLLYDPILMDDRFDAPLPAPGGAETLCVVPRRRTAKNETVYAHLNGILRPGDRVVSLFPRDDGPSGALAALAAAGEAVPALTMAAMTAGLTGVSACLSERYHGCILALKRGIPTIGLVNVDKEYWSKIYGVYEQVGHGHLLHNFRGAPIDRAGVTAKLEGFDAALVRSRLAAMRGEFGDGMKAIAAAFA